MPVFGDALGEEEGFGIEAQEDEFEEFEGFEELGGAIRGGHGRGCLG